MVFVGLARGLDRRLTLRALGNEARVLYPGDSGQAILRATATDEDALFDVPLQRGCAMLMMLEEH